MEIAVNPEVLWNIILTIVVLPLGFLVRSILGEQKRLDILINKTREEIAKDYVTRESMEATFERLMDSIDKIDEKIDRLQQRTYFQE
jgi:Tfp pilus assembly protein PilO|tara:strand:- start:6 stop:266 length:261 start_codon:yes stop_codon:yes gene_type:complete